MGTTTWNGTTAEGRELVDAVNHNCDCKYGLMGIRLSSCGPHTMMVTEQDSLDRLLFYRNIRTTLMIEEGLVWP